MVKKVGMGGDFLLREVNKSVLAGTGLYKALIDGHTIE